jgi:hypothetical protein
VTRAFEWVKNGKIDKIKAWTSGLGFRSADDHYQEALSAFCGIEDPAALEQLRNQFGQLVWFDETGGPQPAGGPNSLSCFLNKDGEFGVGTTLVRYTPTHVISVLDGDRSKMENAVRTCTTDSAQQVIVHDRTFCPGIHSQTQDSQNHRLISTVGVYNNSYFTNISLDFDLDGYADAVITLVTVIYDFHTNIKVRKKKFLFWMCERKNITWSRNLVMYNNFNAAIGGNYSVPNPFLSSASITSGTECDYNYLVPITYATNVHPNNYNSIALNIDHISQSASITSPYILINLLCQ